ncbi:MAG TPA: lyase family protein [Thermoanaerobaculaceae bacterium]|nr:lyase family protein [Thermoanaerobaculaceae bacterium]
MARRPTGPTRLERDTLGAMEVPEDALYGAQTARAVENFPISGWALPPGFLAALAMIKGAFARANGERGLLAGAEAAAIATAADEVVAGGHLEQFPIDVFQTGSGTSTNMNMNEVLAHLANVRLGGDPAAHRPVHPNDHVNLGQSSNDAVPAALRIAAALAWRDGLRPAAAGVQAELAALGERHRRSVTLGRTHLMDAVPTTYGRVFAAWAERLRAAIERGDEAARHLLVLPLGGTAVGTGINADRTVVARAVALLSAATGLALELESNPAVGISAQDAPIASADALAGVGRVLFAVANDIRLRASGPFGGLGELQLPAVQPGSSIMPGKVNPVIPEAVAQVAIEVEGLAAACRATASLHQLDLSHANPLLAWNLHTIARLLAAASRVLVERCLSGLYVDEAVSRRHAEASPALATALAARIGYERAADVAKAAEAAGATVAETARKLGVLPDAELAEALDLDRMAGVE